MSRARNPRTDRPRDTTCRWNLYTDGSGVARFGIGQNNADFAAAKILLRDRWHYVAGTYDGHHIRIFVDGVAGSQTALHDATIVRTG